MENLTKSGADLTADEHLHAEELLEELQERIVTLGARKNSVLLTTNRPVRYEPLIHTIKIGDETIVVKVRASEILVLHRGKKVADICGLVISKINFDGFIKALAGIRRYMVLDDLASVADAPSDDLPVA